MLSGILGASLLGNLLKGKDTIREDVYSRNSLPKMKEGSYVINIDKFKSIGTHWIALYANGNNGSNLTVQYISIALQLNILQKEILKIIGSKNIITKFIE